MLHSQVLASQNMSEELQTAFQAVIGVLNYGKSRPLRGRLKSGVTICRHNTWSSYTTVKHASPLMPKCFIGYLK